MLIKPLTIWCFIFIVTQVTTAHTGALWKPSSHKNATHTQLIIKFKDANTPFLSHIMSTLGLEIASFENIEDLRVATLTSTFNPVTFPMAIKILDLVTYAEPDILYSITELSNDPLFRYQWSLHNTGFDLNVNDADIDAPEVWNMQKGSTNIVVAVIDVGIDYTHPDLRENLWLNPDEIPNNGRDDDKNGFIDDVYGWDFYSHDNDPLDVENGHGTHVSGIIGAASNNFTGIAGINWNTRIMSLKSFSPRGFARVSDLLPAIKYAVDNGAHIINASWGSFTPSESLKDMIEYAHDNGVIFVAASGNSGRNTEIKPFYPAGYALDNIISVAASDSRDELAYFSNYGITNVDLAAPGHNIISTIPANRYATYSGTSMAAPMVSGAAALMLSHRIVPYSDVISVILQSVDPLPQLSMKVKTNGRLNVYKTLKNAVLPPEYVLKYLYYKIYNHMM